MEQELQSANRLSNTLDSAKVSLFIGKVLITKRKTQGFSHSKKNQQEISAMKLAKTAVFRLWTHHSNT